MRKTFLRLMAVAVVATGNLALAGPPTSSGATAPSPVELPIAAEKNPPGDIPDNQAFTYYRSPLGFRIKVPEGWARRDASQEVSFSDKYNRLHIAVESQATEPTDTSLRANQIAALEKSGKAVRVTSIKLVAIPAGKATVVTFGSNSELNPVTNKAIRLDNVRYYLWDRSGKLVTLTLSSPSGADNLDQWQLMVKSFGWH